MTMDEARKLVAGSLWPKVRDRFVEKGAFELFPKGDPRRLEYLDEETQAEVGKWLEALEHAEEWRTVVDGDEVRRIRNEYRGIYPEVFRYQAYFAGLGNPPDRTAVVRKLLKLKFPEAYSFCFEQED